MSPAESEWLARWKHDRAKGRAHFLRRATLTIGVMPGVAAALLAWYVTPQVGDTIVSGTEWVIGLLIGFVALGLAGSVLWWNTAEKRYQSLQGSNGS